METAAGSAVAGVGGGCVRQRSEGFQGSEMTWTVLQLRIRVIRCGLSSQNARCQAP